MNANEALMHMRFYLADSQKSKFSDDALLSALNLAISITYEMLVGYSSTMGRKNSIIAITDGVGDLPSDFHSTVLVEDSSGAPMIPDYGKISPASGYYRIVGNKIYTGEESVVLQYNYIPASLSTTSDAIDCPNSLTNQLILIAVDIARGDRASADGAIFNMVRALASKTIPYVPDQKGFNR